MTNQLCPFASVIRHLMLAVTLTAVWGAGLNSVCAQTKKPAARPKQPPPQMEDVALTTRDGVQLRCTYYPGPDSKQTASIIMVHDWGGNRGELHPVALWMQQTLKLSVIVPDLRGHGDSTRAEGLEESIDREKLRGRAVDLMTLDIEACKTFLLKQNNEGNLNIEQLGVVGSGFGASLALKWAIQDWSVRNLPALKQGQDVKALILVSPSRSARGTTINSELKNRLILSNISVLTIVGREDARSVSEALRIHKSFEAAWGDQAKEATPILEATTSLQGTELLKSRGTGVDQWIGTFLNRRLVQLGERFPWTDRTSPLK